MNTLRDTLKGRVAIVTGASSGLGRATALALAAEGARLVVTARREDRLQTLVAEVEAAGGTCFAIAGDAAQADTAQTVLADALHRYGQVDMLINNAGQGNYKQLVDTSVEEYDNLMNSNMRSSFLFSRAVAPYMVAQRSGTILFISSVAGLVGVANEVVYSATKFAQVGFAQALGEELRPFGVRVSVLCAGGIKTEFAVGRGRTAESVTNSHMMEAANLAEAVLFACTLPPNVRIPQLTVRHMGEQK